jgi:hypothetical protein
MSATTAFNVASALPISGARFCSDSCERSLEISEILIDVSVIPVVLPAPGVDPVSPPAAVVALDAESSSSPADSLVHPAAHYNAATATSAPPRRT